MRTNKIYQNRGVRRNKKPLKNIVYMVDIIQLKDESEADKYEQYRFNDSGYLLLSWKYESDRSVFQYGFITPQELRELIGDKQWSKFCNGKREFIAQRRVDNKNI
jgi:hypothetical protein